MDNIKVGFSLSPEVISRLEEYRLEKGMTKSACLTAIINDYFESLDAAKKEIDRVNRFAKLLADYTEGKISAQDFSVACNVLSKS